MVGRKLTRKQILAGISRLLKAKKAKRIAAEARVNG